MGYSLCSQGDFKNRKYELPFYTGRCNVKDRDMSAILYNWPIFVHVVVIN